ncbi:hypothetical protein KEM48_005852 [Puccinia striiformis f. sp. tritici PST-130]|nr:hypothetical protein KEM48_005852 [Puccinia striiformis f. sp. tritici PST-130]
MFERVTALIEGLVPGSFCSQLSTNKKHKWDTVGICDKKCRLKSCYEAILSNLIRFESLLQAFVHYKGGMHVSHTMSQPIPDHELSTLRLEISGGQEIKGDMAPAKQDEDCLSLARSLATFLDAWVKFFDNFSLSPLDARSVIEQWSNIVRGTNLLISQIDASSRRIQLFTYDTAKAD